MKQKKHQTTEFVFGQHAVLAKLNNVNKQSVLYVDESRHDARVKSCLELAKKNNVKIHFVDKNQLNKMVQGNHQGVVFHQEQTELTKRDEHDLKDFLSTLNHPAFLLILDGVTDPHNLGACLRSADGAGIDAVIVPKDKSVGLTPVAIKVASGAAESVPFFQVTNLARVLRQLSDDGVWLVGADDKSDQSIFGADLTGALALVLGSEGSGIRRLTKEICQQLVFIPMQGTVNSLNVSVATGVMVYEALRQRENIKS